MQPIPLCLILLAALAGCGSGSPATTLTPIVPTAPTPTIKGKFLYTGNQGASLSGYSINATSGILSPLPGFPLALGLNPTALTHDPLNRFLLVADIAASTLHVFSINTGGALAEVAPSPYITVKEPVSLAVDATGTHVYVASQGGNQVGAYALSSAGVLTPVASSPFPLIGVQSASIGSSSIAVSSNSAFLYLIDLVHLYVFSIAPSTGALTLIQTLPGLVGGDGIALDPAGATLYAVGSGTNAVSTYSIAAATGLLTLAGSSPLLERNGAYTIALSADGRYAFTIENNNDLVPYTIAKGALTPSGPTISGVYGEQIAIDPSGAIAYVPQACSNCPSGLYNVVQQFTIGTAGSLTQLAAPAASGVTPWGVTVISQ